MSAKIAVQQKIVDYLKPIFKTDVPTDIDMNSIGEMFEEFFFKDQESKGEAPMNKLETAFHQFIESGGDKINWNTQLQNKFQRDHKSGAPDHAEHKALKSYADKDAYKLKWAGKCFKKMQETKKHTHSYQKINKKHGKFLNFGMLCEQYAGHLLVNLGNTFNGK
jgi:hypothetical protein